MVMKTIHRLGKNLNIVRTQNGNRIIYDVFSYDVLVCEFIQNLGMGFDCLIRLFPDWDCSTTTKKHITIALNSFGGIKTSSSDLLEGIKCGVLKKDKGVAVKYEEGVLKPPPLISSVYFPLLFNILAI